MSERRLERLRATGRHGTQAERDANEREEAILERLHAGLAEGRPIRDTELAPDEEKAIRGFRFLTQKPVLVLLNVGEGDIAREAELVAGIAERYEHRHAIVDALSAKIEMELGELEPDEAAVFMDELGLHGSSLDRVIALSYRLLGLISFLTAGPDEVRAWPIPDGLDGGRCRRRDPHGPRPGLHPGRDGRLRGPAGARLDRRGPQARQAPLGGQDLPRPGRRRPGDPLQPLTRR